MKTQSKKQRTLDLDSLLVHDVESLPFGVPFRFRGKPADIHIRVKPVQFILNSSLVSDCINAHKCFVVNLTKGTLYIVPGDRFIDKVNAVIQEK